MLESNLQKKVIKICSDAGIIAVKTDSSSTRGWPDLTLVLPCGSVVFMELKHADTGRLSEIQKHIHKRLKPNNALVYTVSSVGGFQIALAEIRGILNVRKAK